MGGSSRVTSQAFSNALPFSISHAPTPAENPIIPVVLSNKSYLAALTSRLREATPCTCSKVRLGGLHYGTTLVTYKERSSLFEFPSTPLSAPENPDVFRIKGTIIPEVLPVTGFFAAYASIFTYLHYTIAGQSLAVGSSLIPILSFVVGLLLAFRTVSLVVVDWPGMRRFWEGRKLWANFVALSRNLARLTWVSNPSSHVLQDGSPNQAAIEAKERLVQLTIALAVSTKHHLRHEPGPNYPDLVHLLPAEFVERIGSASTGKTKPLVAGTIGARNLPMEITHLMSSQMLELRDKVYIDSNLYGAMVFILNDLVQTISSMERVSSTPMPTAYTVHLKQVLGLYCLALPPQLIGQLALFQVPVVSLAAFALFGVARIGDEIEDPFGYDPNDLKLDQFCEDLKLELEAMMEEPPLTIGSRSTP
ncbi:hypothetical protein SpCBS45565_g05549 [Spizellomyces sp. 'palustris']|nr:hypothetical protein SpCBS45565_g05549 [Spizellomyces sp. 'palustris']